MNAVPEKFRDGDGRVGVSLAELIALRSRVTRHTLPPERSRSSGSGRQRSRMHGRGMDYAESRAYQPGDDIRRMDWRLTARSGRLHTKLFEEEREGRLLVLVDQSPSMRFGTRVRFKSVQAARAAALAIWQATHAGERVALMAAGALFPALPPRGGPHGALAALSALARWDASSTSIHVEPLSEALGRARRVARGANRVLLISDGVQADEACSARLTDLGRHARVCVLVVADALELADAPAGRYPFEQAGRISQVDLLAERQRMAFRQHLGGGGDRLLAMAAAAGMPARRIDTVADPLDAVTALLAAPARRGIATARSGT